MITPENAREFQRLGVMRRKQNQRELAEKELQAAIALIAPVVPDDYIATKLVRVRQHLARMDDLLESERDPHAIDRLASAMSKLSEIERILAGRPLPGSRKPSAEPRRRVASTEPVIVDMVQAAPVSSVKSEQ